MENTIEKMKFFALYLGQEFETPNSTGNINWKIFEFWKDYSLISSVLLTPLSKITDEDAIEILQLNSYPEYEILKINKTSDIIGVSFRYKSKIVNNSDGFSYSTIGIRYTKISIEYADFLRSRGYALPYMGLSVEQQIDYGWIKLK